MFVITVSQKHRSRRYKRKPKGKEDTKPISKDESSTSTCTSSKICKMKNMSHDVTKGHPNIWDRRKKQQSKQVNRRKSVMKLYTSNVYSRPRSLCIKPIFIDKRDLNECIAIHLTLMNCGLIKNEFFMESSIIKQIAEYSTGLCLNCKACGHKSCILYGNVMNEQELRRLCEMEDFKWDRFNINNYDGNDILNAAKKLVSAGGGGKGYLSGYYNNEKEKHCHNLYYCEGCLPVEIWKANLCYNDQCGKPIMDITENVLKASDKDSDIDRWYHYDCYLQKKKINKMLMAKKRAYDLKKNYRPKMTYTRHSDSKIYFA